MNLRTEKMKERFKAATLVNRVLLLILSIQLLIGPVPAQADILLPSAADYPRFIMSKAGQIFVPQTVVRSFQKMEEYLEKHYPKEFQVYLAEKLRFQKYYRSGRLAEFYRKRQQRIYQFLGHASWKWATDLPFIGLTGVHLPALVAYSMSQVVLQEMIPEKIKLDKIFEKIFPDYHATYDIKLSSGQMISVYSQNGQLKVQESIWNTEARGPILKVSYPEKGVAIVTLDPHMFPKGVNRNGQKISLRIAKESDNYVRRSRMDASDINVEVTLARLIKASPIDEIFVNQSGRKAFWSHLAPFTTMAFEDNGVGYRTSFSYMAHKLTRIIVASNLAWPMYEVGRQFWLSGGVLNWTPVLTHSYGLFTSFIIGGVTGSAMGSRLIDLAYLTKIKAREHYPDFIERFHLPFNVPGVTPGGCTYHSSRFIKKGTRVKKKTDLERVRRVLQRKMGKRLYGAFSIVPSIVLGGTLAWGLPQLYTKGEFKLRDLYPKAEDPNAQYNGGLQVDQEEGEELIYYEGLDEEGYDEIYDDSVPKLSLEENFEQLTSDTVNSFHYASALTMAEDLQHPDNNMQAGIYDLLKESPRDVLDRSIDFSNFTDIDMENLLFYTYISGEPINQWQIMAMQQILKTTSKQQLSAELATQLNHAQLSIDEGDLDRYLGVDSGIALEKMREYALLLIATVDAAIFQQGLERLVNREEGQP